MNHSTSNLLQALDTLGVQSVRFRLLSDRSTRRHTTPVAFSPDWGPRGKSLAVFSLDALFAAYALRPRKGEYTLHVGDGHLSFEPVSPLPPLLNLARSPKRTARHRTRKSFSGSPHKLAA